MQVSNQSPRSLARTASTVIIAALVSLQPALTISRVGAQTNTTVMSTSSVAGSSGQSPISIPISSSSVTNSSLGIQLVLQLSPSGPSDENIAVVLSVVNLLNSTNTVPYSDDWMYQPGGLADSDHCAFPSPFAFGIFSGNLTLADYQQASPLVLYNSAVQVPSCILDTSPTAFDPLANESVRQSTSGYWTGGYYANTSAVFVSFPAGVYTVIGVDEWGQILLLHFATQGAAITTASSSSSSSQSAQSTTTNSSSPYSSISSSNASSSATTSTSRATMVALSIGIILPLAGLVTALAATFTRRPRRRLFERKRNEVCPAAVYPKPNFY